MPIMEEDDFSEHVFYRLRMELLPDNSIPNKIFTKQSGFYFILDSYCATVINYPRNYIDMPNDRFHVQQQHDLPGFLLLILCHRLLPDHVQIYIVKRIQDFAAQCNATEKKGVVGIGVRIGVEKILGDVPQSNGVYYVDSEVEAVVELFDESCKLVPNVKSSTNGSGFEGECAICMEPFLLGKEVTQMPCSHGYHLHCIGTWLQNHGSCPLCRFKLKL